MIVVGADSDQFQKPFEEKEKKNHTFWLSRLLDCTRNLYKFSEIRFNCYSKKCICSLKPK